MRRLLIIFYIVFLLFLGIRPSVPYLYNTYLASSSVGGWNMYQYLLNEEVECYLLLDSGERIIIDWQKYMYHSTFASSAHPNYRKEMGDHFCDYLLKNDSKIDSLIKRKQNFELKLMISLIKENKDTITYDYSRRQK